MPNGRVVHFDRRRGYGFITPDDGGDDVFVHQNNINMEGFRYLQLGERVGYELEVGKVGKEGKVGMKAISVSLLEPRQPRPERDERDNGYANGGEHENGGAPEGEMVQERREPRQRYQERAPRSRGGREDGGDAQRLRRKLERLISVLVEKGVLAPGEIDGLDGSAGAKSVENQQA